MERNFASDNNAGVHPDIMKAMQNVNQGHVVAYGDDIYTKQAREKIKEVFGDQCRAYFVYNGTAANVIGISSLLKPYEAVICAESAHVNEDECGAPERFGNVKLLTIETKDGKLRVNDLKKRLKGKGFVHHVQPRMVSITQSTEMGTLYSPEEIKEIAGFCKDNNLFLHMDGARIYNAAAALDVPLEDIVTGCGVDILSLGGTKNGMMFGEAVVLINPAYAADFLFYQKQGMQLASKMRFIAAQFHAMLSNGLWLANAGHANRMAQLLADKIAPVPDVAITQPVLVNAVFATVPEIIIPELQDESFFYVWNESTSEVRWMTSFDTTEEDIERFVTLLTNLIAKYKA